MRLSIVTARVTTLENILTRLRLEQRGSCQSGEQVDDSTVPVLKQLQKLAKETKRIKEQTEVSGDYRTALACIHQICRILELVAKLGGELDDKTQTNILNVNLDPGAGKRIAEVYLARLKSGRQGE
jgi:DNA-binding TFAR19-related protein (PDSD5 family)